MSERPRDASAVMLQLRRILPAEGWLMQRMAGLRAKALFTRKGHIANVFGVISADSDADHDVDVADFAWFQTIFTGSGD